MIDTSLRRMNRYKSRTVVLPERGSAVKRVLFVCVENACRSQMAEALFNELASGGADAKSAGSDPAEQVEQNAVKAMEEIGIDTSDSRPKELSLEMVEEADKVILMGCGIDACPVVPKEAEEWDLEDPSGRSIEKFRKLRDEIKRKVEMLIEELESEEP